MTWRCFSTIPPSKATTAEPVVDADHGRIETRRTATVSTDIAWLINGPHNLAVLRHMAMNVMQKDGEKGSLRGKIKRAGWDEAYLARLLTLF